MTRAFGALAWLLLGALAAAGVALSGSALFAWTPYGRAIVAKSLVRYLDDQVAGSLELDAISVLPHGGVEIRGLRVDDPDGHRVLTVARARVFADLTRLRGRTVGLTLELDGPELDLSREADGTLALARAFAPTHPRPAGEGPSPPRAARPSWTVRVLALRIRGGAVRSPGAPDAEAVVGSDLSVDARGEIGPPGGFAEARLRGDLQSPVSAPLEIDVSASLAGDAVSVPVLTARLGENALDAIAQGDLGRRTGRIALLRLGVSRSGAGALVPAAARGADLAARGYAESDGTIATASLQISPAGPELPGRASAALAARLPPSRPALGFDISANQVDPARLLTIAPAGRITGTVRGAAQGTSFGDLRGHVALALSPSRMRAGEIGPAELIASSQDGTLEVKRLEAAAPGGRLSGSGRWARAGPVEGTLRFEAADLERVVRNLTEVLGRGLPPLSGRARVEATFSGTADAPSVRAAVDAPRLATPGVVADGLRMDADLAGPLRQPSGRIEARVDRIAARGLVGRGVLARATVKGGAGEVMLLAPVPGLGPEPLRFEGQGRLLDDGGTLELAALTIAYPGTRFALSRPARIALAGPSVDRLELASGRQQIALEGGIGRQDALDAHLVVQDLDLRGLPPGTIPAGLGLAGTLSLDARASGTTRRPSLAGRASLAGAAIRGLEGLNVLGEAAYDGASQRATVDLDVLRAAGGSVEAHAKLPLALARARPSEPIEVRLRGEGIVLEDALAATGIDLGAGGKLVVDAELSGSVGSPIVHATARVVDGFWGDLDALALDLTAEDEGDHATVRIAAARGEAPIAALDVKAPVDVAALLAHPAVAAGALRTAPISAHLALPGTDLSAFGGTLGLPQGLAGQVRGEAQLEGTMSAPRGRGTFELIGGAVAGYSRIDAAAAAVLARDRIQVDLDASVGGAPVLRLQAALAAAPERLRSRAAVAAAPLSAEVVVPHAPLQALGRPGVPLAGELDARLVATGTLAAPELVLQLAGADLAIGNHRLGSLTAAGRHARGRTEAELALRSATGGSLQATSTIEAPLGMNVPRRSLADAPARFRVVARDLDMGLLPAILPGVIRDAGGKLACDLSTQGPLARLRPLGTIRVADGRLDILEFGEWTEVELDAQMAQDGIALRRASARHGGGRVDLTGALHGPLWSATQPARIELSATARNLSIARAGIRYADVDLDAKVTGTLGRDRLDAMVTIPGGTLRLPKKTPRTLQSLEARSDIQVGPRKERRRRVVPARAPGAAPGPPPFEAIVHVVAPGRFWVRSEVPRIQIELKADARLELGSEGAYAEGSIDVVQGTVEPIGGRTFTVQRGKLLFTGGPPSAAEIDVQARYENPAANVTVTVFGRARAPEIKLSSEPPMDEGAIALLIATGRTDLKPGAGAVDTATGQAAGLAALGAVVQTTFKNLLSDKLPLDVTFDVGTFRAGRYIGDKVYVGYVRRLEANPAAAENPDEIRIEYRITPRWNFEVRYGNANLGSASLLWSKDY